MKKVVELVLAALCVSQVAEAEWIEHCDLEGPFVPYVYESASTGSLNLAEYNDITNQSRPLSVQVEGDGQIPYISQWSLPSNNFIRFWSLRSDALKDRSELVIKRDIENSQLYHLRFNLKLPSDGYNGNYFFPSENDWFMITQVRQDDTVSSSPPLSLNLRRQYQDLFLDVVGRNELDGYERLLSLKLNDPQNFTFNNWNRIRLTFRMGPDGYVELWSNNNSDLSGMSRLGIASHKLSHGTSNSNHTLKMGLYRGGSSLEDRLAYFVDIDDIELYTP